jgi:hypothetical protein
MLGIPQCPSDNNRASKISELQLAGRELSDGVGPGSWLLQHEEVAGTAQCLPKGAAGGQQAGQGVSNSHGKKIVMGATAQ